LTVGLPTPTIGGTNVSPASRTDARRQRLVARRQQRCTFCGGFQRPGDHDRNRLVGVADLVALQHLHPKHERVGLQIRIDREFRLVRRRHHVDHAGMTLRGLDVERGHAAARDAGDGNHRKQHALRMVIGRIGRLSPDLQNAVTAGHGLADIRPVPDMRGRVGEVELRHARLPETDAKGEAGTRGNAFWRSGRGERVSERTTMRRASSILKALSPDGFAPASANCAASRKLAAFGATPSMPARPHERATGFAATPPSASRASTTLPFSKLSAAAADTTANA
jgi:hypothetical protein